MSIQRGKLYTSLERVLYLFGYTFVFKILELLRYPKIYEEQFIKAFAIFYYDVIGFDIAVDVADLMKALKSW